MSSGSAADEVKSQERLSAVNVTIRMLAESTPGGFMRLGQPIKAGAILSFETPQHSIRGTILRVAARPAGNGVSR